MARVGLFEHRKFKRLARIIGGRALAAGSLELIWAGCYDRGDDYLGDSLDVEAAADWQGAPGALTKALLEAGGEGSGFIEQDPDREGYRVHDLFTHAPPHVRRRVGREIKRSEAGETLSTVRRAAGIASGKKRRLGTNGEQVASHRVATERLGRVEDGTGRGRVEDGTGKNLAAVEAPAAAPEPLALGLVEPKRALPGFEPVTRDAALKRIAVASNGRFVASKPTKGAVFKLDAARKAHPDGEIFDRVGQWLAAGGDWRAAKGQTLDGRNLGDLDAWVAQAEAWDGHPIAAGTIRGAAKPDLTKGVVPVLKPTPGYVEPPQPTGDIDFFGPLPEERGRR